MLPKAMTRLIRQQEYQNAGRKLLRGNANVAGEIFRTAGEIPK